MSMYTQLLEAGLQGFQVSDSEPSTGQLLAELLRCGGRLGSDVVARSGPIDVLGTVTDELAYDIALIALTRRLGISCDVSGFEQPQHERRILEEKLRAHGIHLDDLDVVDRASPESKFST
jgi:hypothetical protein